ncbi:pseudouridine synthase, partial [Maribellus luteus]
MLPQRAPTPAAGGQGQRPRRPDGRGRRLPAGAGERPGRHGRSLPGRPGPPDRRGDDRPAAGPLRRAGSRRRPGL